MATYTSLSSLISGLQQALAPAVDDMTEQILHEVNLSVSEYYGEFKPTRYKRTNTLKATPQATWASGGGGEASAEVFMNTGFAYDTGTWSMSDVVDAANNSTHGGIPGGHPLWDEPMNVCHSRSHSMWAGAFAAAGLNVS